MRFEFATATRIVFGPGAAQEVAAMAFKLGRRPLVVTGQRTGRAADSVAWVSDLVEAMHVPRLVAHGITPTDFPEIVDKSRQASSMKANPIELSADELTAILHQAL